MPLEDYQIIQRIGSGKYASVYKVKRLKDSSLFALKKIILNKMTTREKANSISEVKLLSSIKHPNVVGLIEAFYDEFIESLWQYSAKHSLILEFADGGDLNQKINQHFETHKQLDQTYIWTVIQQIGKGLQFLHSNNIMHRDLKATNILLFNDGQIKIGDFNVSTKNQGLSYTRTGTLTYASPEVWKGQPYNNKSDIWSFGCLIYELVSFRRPFEGQNIEEIYKKISKCHFTKLTENYSRELKDLVTFMIQLNSKLRPSATTIIRMSNKFITSNNAGRNVQFKYPNNFIIPGFSESLKNAGDDSILSYQGKKRTKTQTMSRNKLFLTPILTAIKPNNIKAASSFAKQAERRKGTNRQNVLQKIQIQTPAYLFKLNNSEIIAKQSEQEEMNCSIKLKNLRKYKKLRKYTQL